MDLLTFCLRTVLVLSLILLIGAPPIFSVILLELESSDRDVTRTYRAAVYLVGAALVAAILSETALATEDVLTSDAVAFDVWITSTAGGQAWGVLVLVGFIIGALTIGHHLSGDHGSPQLWLKTVFSGGLAMIVAFCWTRYSPAAESATVAILVKSVHMTGAALWTGGLAVLAVLPALLPRSSIDSVRLVLSIVRRFSAIAILGVTAAFTTGIVIAAWHVPTLGALIETPYGVLLSLKIGLVLLTAAIGGFNRFLLHEQIAKSADETGYVAALPGLLPFVRPPVTSLDALPAFVRSVRLELLFLLLVVGISVGLTTAVTPAYELLEFADGSTVPIAERVVDVRLTGVFFLGALGTILAGSLMLGYELGSSRAE